MNDTLKSGPVVDADIPMTVEVVPAQSPGGPVTLRLFADDGRGCSIDLTPLRAVAWGSVLVRHGLAALDHPETRLEEIPGPPASSVGDPLPDGSEEDANGPNG